MSSLDQTQPDPPHPVRSPAAERGPVCSVATGAPAATPARGGGTSVPSPRSRGEGKAAGRDAQGRGVPGAAPSAAAGDTSASAVTAANLRTGLGARLRAAYERGATVDELSAACRRPPAETRELLARAGTDLSPAAAEAAAEIAAGRRNRPTSRWALPAAPDPSAASASPTSSASSASSAGRTAPGPPRVKRPSPARRLSRLHPRTQDPADAAPPTPHAATRAATSAATSADAIGAKPAGSVPGSAGLPYSEAPLGVLIGGTPKPVAQVSRPAAQRYVRVDARVIRPGRGTCLVVLPAWREAIAVSVPTERLLAATGLGGDELSGAELSVMINPAALHDRELALHGWRTGPAPATRGRRG